MNKEIIVVEGKNDKAHLLNMFPDLNIITTNGSQISEEVLVMLLELAKTNTIILLLDPDYPGERIRSIINNRIKGCVNIFVEKKKAIDYHKHKVGIEHMRKEDLEDALKNKVSFAKNNEIFKPYDLYELKLLGATDSANKRAYIASRLHLGFPNGKTFLKRLNMAGITKDQLRSILDEKNWNDITD